MRGRMWLVDNIKTLMLQLLTNKMCFGLIVGTTVTIFIKEQFNLRGSRFKATNNIPCNTKVVFLSGIVWNAGHKVKNNLPE